MSIEEEEGIEKQEQEQAPKQQIPSQQTPMEQMTDQQDDSGIDSLGKVSADPKRNSIAIGIAAAVFSYIIYYFFIAGDSDKPLAGEPLSLPGGVVRPAQISEEDIPPIPKLPEPPAPEIPEIEIPEPIEIEEAVPQQQIEEIEPALPPVPQQAILPEISSPLGRPDEIEDAEAKRRRREQKRKSNITLLGGAGGAAANVPTAQEVSGDPSFTRRGAMDRVLGRGKIIDATIETALNSDFGGEVRAVIARDVYAQNGKTILIPKGSRVFGTYGNEIASDYGYINITWNRLDLTTGYTITMAATGVDNLGRQGSRGEIDDKYTQRITNSLLTSALSVGFAYVVDKVVPPAVTSDVSTQNTDAAAAIRSNAIQIFNDSTKDPTLKVTEICAFARSQILDKTSATYTTLDSTCTTLEAGASGVVGDALSNAVFTAANTAADTLIQTASSTSNQTKEQQAAQDGFDEITNAITDMVKKEYKRTITINQGARVKIYVNKDYEFPLDAVKRGSIIY